MDNFSYLESNYDLSLPDWGPYSKKLFGLSHLAEKSHGGRMDFTVIPGICRRPLAVPDSKTTSGYLPWDVSADLEYYSYRQQIEWKNQIYCDISFSKLSDNSRLMRCECVNNSEFTVPFAVHLLSMFNYSNPEKVVIKSDRNIKWIDVFGNNDIKFAAPDIRDRHSADGMRRGEELTPNCMNGACIGRKFGKNIGDAIRFAIPKVFHNKIVTVLLRFKMDVKNFQELIINSKSIKIIGNGTWTTEEIFQGKIKENYLNVICTGGSEIKIDGIILIPAGIDKTISFETVNLNTGVNSRPSLLANSRIMNFGQQEHSYGLWWSQESSFVRHYSVTDMMHVLRYVPGVAYSCYPEEIFQKDNEEHALDVVIQPITVKPGKSKIIYTIICSASNFEIDNVLKNCVLENSSHEELYKQAKAKRICSDVSSYGKKFLFSQERMTAVTMTNVIYPVRVKGSYVRHHTPGRLWNSLYTWDSGFIGMGLLEMDYKRAIENLNVYLTEPADNENAFIDHGTWVPTQIYLFQEIINRYPACRHEILEFFYPRLKNYYCFFSGLALGSITRKFSKSGLICTWDYNYNSGGWDDYPPQWEIYTKKLNHILPTISSVHAVRCAKFLLRIAGQLNLDKDMKIYQNDIEILSNALQRYSWDAKAGYFSYVVHDHNGEPKEFYRHESGLNFNMGLDGASPLISGTCTPEQQEILWNKLSSSTCCWSKYGLSCVDKSAPYFKNDGYWNGSVWMPYQWFFWKAALDDGKADFAWQIAKTGLELWQRETENSYCCYEYFDINTGRGAGWHHFSALSVPVLLWFGAYFKRGRLTVGFDVDILKFNSNSHKIEAEISVNGRQGEMTTLIAVTGDAGNWKAEYNGNAVKLYERIFGTYELNIPKSSQGWLKIRHES